MLPKRPKTKARTVRRRSLPELAPIAPVAPKKTKLPAAARTVVPRRITKNGVVQVADSGVPSQIKGTTSFVLAEPSEAEIIDEDAKLRAAIAAAIRETPDESAAAPVQRRRRPMLVAAMLIGVVAAGVWALRAEDQPPQLVDVLPAALSQPAPGLDQGLAGNAPSEVDGAPSFAAASVLSGGATDAPRPYRVPSRDAEAGVLNALPTQLALDDTALRAAPGLDAGVIRGTVSRLPALARN